MIIEKSLRYPIGKPEVEWFSDKGPFNVAAKEEHLSEVGACPSIIENAVFNLTQDQLNVPYREGGWTSRQVVHHVADSHMNAYVRFKLTLTEDSPIVKSYEESAWAELSDSKILPVSVSLDLLRALHSRWLAIMKNMTADDWERTFYHPSLGRAVRLWDMLGTYAWHGKHHAAQISNLRDRMGWIEKKYLK
ncbi:MAG: YfiT family bacillithiol transferase [Ferruginibacter sp.]